MCTGHHYNNLEVFYTNDFHLIIQVFFFSDTDVPSSKVNPLSSNQTFLINGTVHDKKIDYVSWTTPTGTFEVKREGTTKS